MTLLFIDGFDVYGANADSIGALMAGGDYLEADFCVQRTASVAAAQVRTGRGSLALNNAASDFRWRAPADYSTMVQGIGYYIDSGTARVEELFYFEFNTGSSHVTQVKIERDTNNALVAKNGSGTILATSSIQVLNLQAWQFIEAKVTANASAGSVVVRIDQKEVINVAGVTTITTGATVAINQVRHARNTDVKYVDDFYVLNDAGSVNNDFLGPIEVHTLMPNAAGSTQTWSAVGAANQWQTVDDLDPDDDTTYVVASTIGNKQFFHVSSFTSSVVVTDVFGVKVNVLARKEVAGSNSLTLMTRFSSVEASSGVKTLDTTYAIISEIFETKPDGGSWTQAAVSAMQIGVTIVSTA